MSAEFCEHNEGYCRDEMCEDCENNSESTEFLVRRVFDGLLEEEFEKLHRHSASLNLIDANELLERFRAEFDKCQKVGWKDAITTCSLIVKDMVKDKT